MIMNTASLYRAVFAALTLASLTSIAAAKPDCTGTNLSKNKNNWTSKAVLKTSTKAFSAGEVYCIPKGGQIRVKNDHTADCDVAVIDVNTGDRSGWYLVKHGADQQCDFYIPGSVHQYEVYAYCD